MVMGNEDCLRQGGGMGRQGGRRGGRGRGGGTAPAQRPGLRWIDLTFRIATCFYNGMADFDRVQAIAYRLSSRGFPARATRGVLTHWLEVPITIFSPNFSTYRCS